MYTGKNPSALRSMDWLRKSLLELLQKQSYAQITVREICAGVGLSRQTFYQMFTSKNEIMEYHFSALFAEFADECGDFQHGSLSDLTCSLFRFFHRHQDFINVLIKNNMSHILEQQFEVYLHKIPLFRDINDREKYPDYSLAFVAGALTQILVYWFQRGFDLSAAEVGQLTEQLLTGAVFHTEIAVSDNDPPSKKDK